MAREIGNRPYGEQYNDPVSWSHTTPHPFERLYDLPCSRNHIWCFFLFVCLVLRIGFTAQPIATWGTGRIKHVAHSPVEHLQQFRWRCGRRHGSRNGRGFPFFATNSSYRRNRDFRIATTPDRGSQFGRRATRRCSSCRSRSRRRRRSSSPRDQQREQGI